MEVERTPNKSQHTKLTLEKKILPPFLPEFELATFRSQVRCSTHKLFRLPCSDVHLRGCLYVLTLCALVTDHSPAD